MALILIVEDEVFIREGAEWTLQDLGHQTLSASDLGEAMTHLSDTAPIHALFVDMRLGALPFGGYEIADQAVVMHPGLRVLYTSGTPLTAELARPFVSGARFLQKPYSPQNLAVSINHLLH